MELEWKKTCLDAYEAGGELTLTQEETAETIVPDYCPDIARIIGTAGRVELHSREIRDGRGAVSGAVRVTVLYAPDGEGGVRTLDFAMPFTAGFLSPEGFLALCLFDAGNAVMCTGGTYAVLFREPGSLLKQFASIVKRLLSSFAILTYLVVAALSVTHTRIPDVILHIIDIPANANTFLAMIMIGMSVNLNIRLESLKRLLRLLGLRYLGSVLMGAFVYWCLPFSEDVRLGILLVLFAPLPAMGIIFSMKGRMNWQLAANLNTMSVLCSVVIMSAMLSLLV